jgi:selenocysteine lyase/cysteine desulfurase
VDEFLSWYSSVHRGTGFTSLVSTEAYNRSREIVARFVGANPETHTIIFGKNTTEAINKLVNRLDLEPSDVAIATGMEHHSHDLPWRPRALGEHVDVRADGSLELEDFQEGLGRFRGRLKLVAVTGASNVSGFVPPIYDMAEMAHQRGTKILVDCAQLAAHRAANMGSWAHQGGRLCGRIGAQDVRTSWHRGTDRPQGGFCQRGTELSGSLQYRYRHPGEVYWAEPLERDEAGSPNVVGAVARRPASAFCSRWEEIGVRNGCFCAHPYLLRMMNLTSGVYQAYRHRVLRHDRSFVL